MDDLVDGTPVGKTAESTVVDEEVGVELAGTDAGFIDFFAGVVGVDGKEFEAALGTEFDSFIQQTAFAGCPQDECVSFRLYFLEGCYGEGEFLADLGILVFDDGAVEIYCYQHCATVCSFGVFRTSMRSHLSVQVATMMTPATSTTTLLSRAPLTLMNVPSRPSNWPPWTRTLTPLLRLISSGLKKRRPSLRVLVTFIKLSICPSETTTMRFFPSPVGMKMLRRDSYCSLRLCIVGRSVRTKMRSLTTGTNFFILRPRLSRAIT